MELGIGQASEQLDVASASCHGAPRRWKLGTVALTGRLGIRESLGDIAGLLDPECLTVGIEAPDTLECFAVGVEAFSISELLAAGCDRLDRCGHLGRSGRLGHRD